MESQTIALPAYACTAKKGAIHGDYYALCGYIKACIGLKFLKIIRTRLQPIRTVFEVPVKIIIQPPQRILLYQKLAKKVEGLFLGMSFRAIGRSLGVNKRTVMRAYKYIKRPI